MKFRARGGRGEEHARPRAHRWAGDQHQRISTTDALDLRARRSPRVRRLVKARLGMRAAVDIAGSGPWTSSRRLDALGSTPAERLWIYRPRSAPAESSARS